MVQTLHKEMPALTTLGPGFSMPNEQFKFRAILAQLYLSVSKINFPNVIDQISTFNSNRAERALF